VLDPQGRFLRAFGSQGTADGKFNYPWGVTTDALGFIYVCDKENHRVQVRRGTRPFGPHPVRSLFQLASTFNLDLHANIYIFSGPGGTAGQVAHLGSWAGGELARAVPNLSHSSCTTRLLPGQQFSWA